MTSMAAQRRVCLPFVVLLARGSWIAAIILTLVSASYGATQQNRKAGALASADAIPSSTSLDSSAVDSGTGFRAEAGQQRASEQPQVVIERIEFLNNRRVRSDTMKARTMKRL
jgi:hypothetical protein